MSELRVTIEDAEGHARAHDLSLATAVWLGRDASCDVVLESEHVSRRHVCIERSGDVLRVRDTSVNGTEVDGHVLHRRAHVVVLPAELRVGPFRLQLSVQRSTRAAAVLAAPRGVPHHALVAAPPVARSAADVPLALRRRIQHRLIDHLDLARLEPSRIASASMRPKVIAALEQICGELAAEILDFEQRRALVAELTDEALALGPLTGLLADPSVSEIMVVDPETIYVERRGVIEGTALRFTDGESVRAVIERIVTPLGRRIDESSPLVDARLPDGSRVNAIIPPLASRGPCITIRKFSQNTLSLDELASLGSLSVRMASFLSSSVRARKNIVIAGGTGSGKTTLLNVLSAAIPNRERIVTIEDAAELRLQQKHVVALEARPANLEGKGAYTIRDLLKNALRMRPDRIVVGECRGGEAVDMLQAMNTGHEGSMTTLHANSPREACARLETLCLMAGLELPMAAVRRQIASSVHLIAQQARFADGSRRITSITEVVGLDPEGELELHEIFRFTRADGGHADSMAGSFEATGYLPSFADELIRLGLDAFGSSL